MSAVHGINSLRPITVYHERREHACVPRRHAGRRHLPDGIHAPVQPVHKPRPVCAQSHGRKCESGSRRRFEPASAESNVDCHDIHAIAAEPDGFRSQFTFPGVGPQHGSHAIAVEIDSRPQVVMAIRLNEALRASVGSTNAPNRVLDDSVCRTDAHKFTLIVNATPLSAVGGMFDPICITPAGCSRVGPDNPRERLLVTLVTRRPAASCRSRFSRWSNAPDSTMAASKSR